MMRSFSPLTFITKKINLTRVYLTLNSFVNQPMGFTQINEIISTNNNNNNNRLIPMNVNK